MSFKTPCRMVDTRIANETANGYLPIWPFGQPEPNPSVMNVLKSSSMCVGL